MAYYVATGAPDDGSRGQTGPVRAEFDLIQTAFEMLGTPGSSALGTPFKWSTSTTAADPGAGYIKVNNATLSSATAAYIDNANANGSSVTALLDLMGASTNPTKAILRLTLLTDSTKWVAYTVTACVDSTGYRTATMSYLSGSATFAAENDIQLEFAIVGNKGDKGDTGASGVNGNLWVYEARTSNTKLTVNDTGKVIEITSGTFSQTIDAKSTFVQAGATGTLIYWNSGTGIITFTPDTALPDLIDGNTTRKVYPGEMFLLAPKGTGWTAVVLKSMLLTDTAAGTWQPEPGYSEYHIGADGSGSGGGGGGGGGSGRGLNTNSGSGGAGGGGGGPGQSGQHSEVRISSKRLAAKITGAGRGTIAYAPGSGGTGGSAGTGGAGATSGGTGNAGTVGGFGAAGNPTTVGSSGDAWFLSALGGAIQSSSGGNEPRGGAGSAGNGANAGGTAGTASNAAAVSASGPDIAFSFKGPQEQNTGDAAAGTNQTSAAPGTAGGHGSSPSRAFYTSTNDVTGLGATNAPGRAGEATLLAGTPAAPATPPQAPAGCGGYGGGGGGGSAGVGAGSNSATSTGGAAAPGGLGGAGQVVIRGVV